MSTAERLHGLRLLLGGQQLAPSTKQFWSAPQLEPGIPRGVVVELLGPCKTEWVIQFLAMHPEFKIFWAERDQSILPTALRQRGLDLTKITFGTFGKNLVQPLRRIIQSQSFEVILAPNLFEEIKVFQAFQLFTEKANSTLFLFGENEPSPAWPISLQLDIHKLNIHKGDHNKFAIEVLKQKHGK
ncbi:MAG: hypothetical protein H7061_01830 [Bdellovibrionaceae bacterium]|nr:hypothetical protein [Bdellovibrio sp.]